MTTVPAPALVDSDATTARRAQVPLAVASALVIGFLEVMRSNSVGEAASMIGLGLVALAVVHGLVVRRGLAKASAPVAAVVMGVLGVLLVAPAFWSTLPLVLGGGAALLGYAGKRSARSGACITGLVLGLLSMAAYVGIYAADWIAHPAAGGLL